jgi:5-methyltetrahydrofolate--homocysteine methyltransferase
MSRGEQIRQELDALLRQRILLLDGAMGTMIQSHKLDEAGYRGKEFARHTRDLRLNNDALNLSQPEIIAEIHRQYLDAGADIIETNTFNSNAISMAEYALERRVPDLNFAGAQIALMETAGVLSPGRWGRRRKRLRSRMMFPIPRRDR